MTDALYKEFREDFQKIVWWKGECSSKRKYISNLYSWDKDSSHTKPIEKATDDYHNAKKILKEQLDKYGLTYEQLLDNSKRLGVLMGRIRTNQKSLDKYVSAPLKIKQTKERLLTEFNNYIIK